MRCEEDSVVVIITQISGKNLALAEKACVDLPQLPIFLNTLIP